MEQNTVYQMEQIVEYCRSTYLRLRHDLETIVGFKSSQFFFVIHVSLMQNYDKRQRLDNVGRVN